MRVVYWVNISQSTGDGSRAYDPPPPLRSRPWPAHSDLCLGNGTLNSCCVVSTREILIKALAEWSAAQGLLRQGIARVNFL